MLFFLKLKNLPNIKYQNTNENFFNIHRGFCLNKQVSVNKLNSSIRPLKIFEFKEVLKNWTLREGWNPGKYEYLPFYMADANGHKGLFIDKKLIACLSAVRFSNNLAYLGLYMVNPFYRQKGLGEILAKSVLNELSGCKLIGINAVQNQVSNYHRKYGFVTAHLNSRWVGKPCHPITDNYFHKNPSSDIKIIGKENININQLIDYDSNIFSVNREVFLRNWIEMPESHLLTAIKGEKICGYGLISKCYDGYKLAPLFADDKEIAKKLYISFTPLLNCNTIQVDIPETNHTAVKLAVKFGLFRSFKTTRMYKGEETLIDKQNSKNDQTFALTTLEIG